MPMRRAIAALGRCFAVEEPVDLGPSFTLCTPSSLATSSARARMPVDDPGWMPRFRPAGSAQYSGGVDKRPEQLPGMHATVRA